MGRSFALAYMNIQDPRSPGNVVNDIVFDIHAMVAPGFVGMVICRYCWARFEYCANVDVPRASMTELLMAASVGRWFMYLSLGLSTSHARCARVGVVVLVCKEVCY
jgi:hypothetical protein